MLYVVLAIQVVTVILVVLALLRRSASPAEATDPRLLQLLAADLPTQIARSDARSQALDSHLRDQLAQLRTENATASASLRNEVLGTITALSSNLATTLEGFRTSSAAQANESREALHQRLNELRSGQNEHLDRIRKTVEESLDALNKSNEKKLEEMRVTVDEKLNDTLQSRMTEHFGLVSDQLAKVYTGLGEMTKLSAGVDDLSRIFTNVKSRGQFAEAMLDNLLKQMLAPSQFVRNAQVRPDTQEVVEFAVRFPGINGEVLLPIDSKFPRESADRLETAYESGSAAEIAAARKVFENAIRTEAKRICSKYINEPVTTPNAIMFLPTEGLYAEVMRRDGLHDDIQQNCHVMIAGPSNLSAVLTSFQMVFALVNLQKKGGEVWNVLASARSEFGKFGVLMEKMDKQVGTVQNTIREIGTRTRAITKTLKDVSKDELDVVLPSSNQTAFDGLLPMLAASEEDTDG